MVARNIVSDKMVWFLGYDMLEGSTLLKKNAEGSTVYEEKNNGVATVLCEHTFQILW